MDESLQKKLLIGVLCAFVIGAGYYVWSSFGDDAVTKTANTRTLMDSQTGELFEVEVTPDFPPYPHENPKTKTKTLFPTEVCWKGECLDRGGTPTILNRWLGSDEPTYCSVCGSLVRDHNPGPPRGEGQ